MNRTITYLISDKDAGFTIEQNLRHRGYSAKNITHLKKTPESVLLNGIWVHMTHHLTSGDELVIRIVEEQSSKRVPPVEHPIHIVYEDEDILVIDKQAYDLVIKGKRVDAPPKEIELLYFLASSPNRVFTRAQLLDDVWGFDYFGDTRTVDVHVKRLREKLEGVSDKWELKTVWGVGYKFETKE